MKENTPDADHLYYTLPGLPPPTHLSSSSWQVRHRISRLRSCSQLPVRQSAGCTQHQHSCQQSQSDGPMAPPLQRLPLLQDTRRTAATWRIRKDGGGNLTPRLSLTTSRYDPPPLLGSNHV